MSDVPDVDARPGRAHAGKHDAPIARVTTPTIGPGSLLDGRYRLGDRIGAGGMATIFRARDEVLERTVAVKVLHAHLAHDPALLARFETEARHAAALVHPNIVNVFDEGVAGLPYIVMEHVDGPSLRDVLRQRGRLSPAEALAVVGPVCAGLAKAHAAGVIHRDIKPENVLIDAEGRPKVADFGIARVIAATSHTQTGALVGSVHYLAPELVDGRESSAASDQYALGILTYELLTGEKALPADSPMAVALRHAREDVPRPSERNPECPPEVDAVVARSTAHDPDKRYPDVVAFARALDAAVPSGPRDVVVSPSDGDERTVVIPATADPTPGRRTRRVAAWIAGVLLFVSACAAGGLASWHYLVAPVTNVPPLVGLTQSEALAATDELGLGLVVARHVHRLEVPDGVVVAQEPSAGDRLRRGQDLSVVLSSGPRRVDLPDATGLAERQAHQRLRGNAFSIEVVRRFHDSVPRGAVIAQEPAGGTVVEQGSAVTLVVSRGVQQVTVPDLTGLNRRRARAALREAGLTAGFTEAYNDDFPDAGTVFGQDVEPGARVDKGSRVSATVSLGPLTLPMPNVRGRSVEDATAELEALGLTVSVDGQPRPSFGPFTRGEVGLVEEQLPQPEEAVRRGDTVTLFTFTE